MSTLLSDAFSFAQAQVKRQIAKYPTDYYPMYTVRGEFGHDIKRWTHWCDGFYPGQMFIFAEATGESFWLDEAVKRSTPLAERQYDRAVHDLGFLFFSTYLRWRDLGGPEKEIDALLDQAGKTMAMRFMQNGQYLRSFVEPASLFIDIMMNVGTIFRAGLRGNDEHLLCDRAPALRDDPPNARARRRLDLSRGAFRPGDRRVSPAEHAPGLSRRLLLEPGPRVVALRLHANLWADGARHLPRNRDAQR